MQLKLEAHLLPHLFHTFPIPHPHTCRNRALRCTSSHSASVNKGGGRGMSPRCCASVRSEPYASRDGSGSQVHQGADPDLCRRTSPRCCASVRSEPCTSGYGSRSRSQAHQGRIQTFHRTRGPSIARASYHNPRGHADLWQGMGPSMHTVMGKGGYWLHAVQVLATARCAHGSDYSPCREAPSPAPAPCWAGSWAHPACAWCVRCGLAAPRRRGESRATLMARRRSCRSCRAPFPCPCCYCCHA